MKSNTCRWVDNDDIYLSKNDNDISEFLKSSHEFPIDLKGIQTEKESYLKGNIGWGK
jgi:predicted patatin/cPLA2 family phospholipase